MREGWKEKEFGDLCELTRGHNPPKSKFINEAKKDYVRFYQIRDGWSDNYKVYVPITPQLHTVKPDDILMVAYRHIGRVFRGVSGAFNVALCKISNNNTKVLNNDFLFYMIPSDLIRGELMKKSERSLIPSMSVQHLKTILIPIPPLQEQKQIVAILDKAFAAIDQAKANVEKNIQNAKELFQSKKETLFDQLALEFQRKPLSEFCEQIFAGGDAPKENFSKEKTAQFNIPIIANAVKNNGLYGYTDKARVHKPSITIAARGSGTGHTEYRAYPFVPIVRLIVLTPISDIISAEFLMFAIKSLTISRSGSAIPQLTVPMIKSYSLSVPDLDRQHQIVASLKNLESELLRYSTISNQKVIELEDLKKSLLQKAFAGELTKSKVPA